MQRVGAAYFFGQNIEYSVVPAGAARSCFTRSGMSGIFAASAAETGPVSYTHLTLPTTERV